MTGVRWTKEEYQDESPVVARKLLGQYLVYETPSVRYAGRIVEAEAYGATYRRQPDDGAHSFRGLTARTEPMFRSGGFSYVYLIYGMYYCLNIVTGPEGKGQAVLIRAIEPVEGISAMLANRHADRGTKNLTNGPGKLCQALGITKKQNGLDLCTAALYIEHPSVRTRFSVVRTPRINIDYADKGKKFPWRFYIKDNQYVSHM